MPTLKARPSTSRSRSSESPDPSPTRTPRKAKNRRAKQMTDQELLSAIDYREQRASGGDVFEDEQRKALKYYFGEPFGDEVEGESQIVMREVYGVIEWIKPMLMKVFFGAEKVLQFTPKSARDVNAAEQETEYINHIITARNDGFLLFMSWFSDALLLKNGYVLAYWDERVDVTESTYNNVDVDTISILAEEDDIEILEAEPDGISDDPTMIDPETGAPQETFKVRIRTKEDVGQVRVKPVPPERVRIDGNHDSVSLKDCRYVRYSERDTISSLREQGFDVEDDLSDDGEEIDASHLSIVRSQNTSLVSHEDDDNDPDPASREVEIHTLWIRIDYDGDGIAELRRVIKVGVEILYNEVDDVIALSSLTPTIISHRHQGMSIADAVMDLQEIKSMLTRGYLNNIYLANNGRYFIDDDRVNMDDFLVSRPGGVVRVQGGVSNAAQPFQHPVLGSTIIQAIEYMDNVLENRTGASPRVLQGQSFDGNAINKTATGINQIMSSVLSRIELVARIFAETGVQDLYRSIHALSLKHARKSDVFDLRGEYVEVDPTSWDKRNQMTITVGVGTGDKNERVQALQMIITAQMNTMPLGLCGPAEIRNSMIKLTQLAGHKDIHSFWPELKVDPQTGEPQGPPPDPKVQAEQAKLEIEKQRAIDAAQIEKRRLDIEEVEAGRNNERASAKLTLDHQTKMAIAAMASDDEMIKAGFEIDDGPVAPPSGPDTPPAPTTEELLMAVLQKMREGDSKPKPIRVEHRRDGAGNLVESVPIYG